MINQLILFLNVRNHYSGFCPNPLDFKVFRGDQRAFWVSVLPPLSQPPRPFRGSHPLPWTVVDTDQQRPMKPSALLKYSANLTRKAQPVLQRLRRLMSLHESDTTLQTNELHAGQPNQHLRSPSITPMPTIWVCLICLSHLFSNSYCQFKPNILKEVKLTQTGGLVFGLNEVISMAFLDYLIYQIIFLYFFIKG